MDQRLVVGVGNIYACESLFRARLSPRRIAGRLRPAQAARLATAIRAVLEEAIGAGGSSLRDYVQADGELGVLPGPLCGLRPRRPALPRLRAADPQARPGQPRDLLVPPLPALRRAWRARRAAKSGLDGPGAFML